MIQSYIQSFLTTSMFNIRKRRNGTLISKASKENELATSQELILSYLDFSISGFLIGWNIES